MVMNWTSIPGKNLELSDSPSPPYSTDKFAVACINYLGCFQLVYAAECEASKWSAISTELKNVEKYFCRLNISPLYIF
jgi:hypothetical protein